MYNTTLKPRVRTYSRTGDFRLSVRSSNNCFQNNCHLALLEDDNQTMTRHGRQGLCIIRAGYWLHTDLQIGGPG